jgi:hypothetical protein
MRRPFLGFCLLTLMLAAVGCAGEGRRGGAEPAADTGFAAMQERGKMAMGVDQYTSAHVFEDLPDGGRIVLQREPPDTVGTGAIRAHMTTIATAFAQGDFNLPGFVHAQDVPGTATMSALRSRITYAADTLPRGGEVRITTADPAAVSAIHDFLAFQRTAHHAEGHEGHAGHTP